MRMSSPCLLLLALFGCNGSTEPTPTPDECGIPEELTNAEFVGGGRLPAHTCWVVNQNLSLSDGTFTVEEGVQVWFATNTSVNIGSGGQLALQGTAAHPIHLGTDDPLVAWHGIQMVDSQGSANAWSHTVIENAGSGNWTGASDSAAALRLAGSTTLQLDGVVLRGSRSHALLAHDSSTTLTMSAMRFEDNATIAWVHPELGGAFPADTVFEGNGAAHVRLVSSNTQRIARDVLWQGLSVPYRVEDRFYVEAELRLDPGATVDMGQGTSIIVQANGLLIGEGTAEAPVVFRGASPGTRGYWKGILVASGGSAAPAEGGLVLDHAEIAGACSEAWTGNTDSKAALYLDDGGAAQITHTTFRDNDHYAVWAGRETRIDGFGDNTLTDNARLMRLHADRVGELAGTGSFAGNDEDRVRIGFSNTDRVSVAAIWKDLGVPYELTDRQQVEAGLTLEAGTVIEGAPGSSLRILADGHLIAEGTSDAPVVFTGVNALASGSWRGLYFDSNSPLNRLTHAEVAYAGSEAWTGASDSVASIYMDVGAALSLEDVAIGPGGGAGIYLSSSTSLACSGMVFDVDPPVYDGPTDSPLPGC